MSYHINSYLDIKLSFDKVGPVVKVEFITKYEYLKITTFSSHFRKQTPNSLSCLKCNFIKSEMKDIFPKKRLG
jgi:hypothetical protein